tara:strand:+ start:848 stop:1849 length:1002 start_codon:yes stop_codon:yes gene_type:complete
MKLSEYLTDIHHPDDCMYLDLNQKNSDKVKSPFWSKMTPYSILVDGRVKSTKRPVYLDKRSYSQLKAGGINTNCLQSIRRNKRVVEYMSSATGASVFVARHGGAMNFRTVPNCDYSIKYYAPEPRIGLEATGDCFQYLPFGRDDYLKASFKDNFKADISDQKDTLITAGFSSGVTPQRVRWAEVIEDHPSLTIDQECMQMGHYNQSVLDHGENGHNLYASKLIRSKFTLCPPSQTIDTTRFWDALSVGSIPVVLAAVTGVKRVSYGLNDVNNFYEHVENLFVPFLLVNPSTFKSLTDADLESAWEDFLVTDWNFDCLTSKYWLDSMQKHIDTA